MTVLDNLIEAPVHVLGIPKDKAVDTARRYLERVGERFQGRWSLKEAARRPSREPMNAWRTTPSGCSVTADATLNKMPVLPRTARASSISSATTRPGSSTTPTLPE